MAVFSTNGLHLYDQAIACLSFRGLVTVWLVYLVTLGIYRLYFSSLSSIPGPRLAALTTWYQAYYDIWLRGSYFRKIEQLHAEYGPIIRINPHEIHINDPEYINEVYAGPSVKRDKYRWLGRLLALPLSTAGTVSHDIHRSRRAALNPYFSKASIRQLEPVVRETVASLLQRFEKCRQSGTVMPVSLAYKAAASDIITGYCFGESTNYLKEEDYKLSFFEAAEAHFEIAHCMLHIGWLGPLLNSLPIPVKCWLMPGLGPLFRMHYKWEQQIEQIRSSSKDSKGKTVFHGIIDSRLPPEEKTSNRLRQEAQALVLAGQDTVSYTLSGITFELLSNPDKLQRLKDELAIALPDPDILPRYAQVENLPYLSAVIQEGLRRHTGGALRAQRVSPDKPLYYKDSTRKTTWTIPAGTPVSMTAYHIHMNESVFPNPKEFIPERWLENPRLDRYSLAFSKGTRMCAGINLAYEELYLIIAAVFRKYDLFSEDTNNRPALKLYETVRERDMEMVADLIVPAPAKGSKGVRVKVI